MNAQIGGLQGQINNTNNTVSNLTGVAEMQSNKSTATNLGGANPSDQVYPSQKAAKSYIDNAIYDAVGSGVPDATTLAAGKVKLAGDLAGTAASPNNVVTSGGRVLAVTAYGENIKEAVTNATQRLQKIEFEGMNFRRDIGYEFEKK
jgi:hypothetical protein